jgi:glycosyltransferase involved in cell wall biosynthesis
MLKVVHISSYDNGGAGNAAMRLHLGLLEIGVNSTFLCAKKGTSYKKVIEFNQKPSFLKSAFIRTPFNAIGLPIDKVNRILKLLKNLTGDYELFTFPDSNADILTHPAVKNADIINLHWVAKFLDYPSFFSKVNRPVVWTLHDMNPIQGGFHYYDEMERSKRVFDPIENNLKRKKAELIARCKNLSVVAPSKWLHNLASNSEAFRSASHFHIPYGLNTELFKDYGKEVSRVALDLPLDKKIISFVSSDIHSPRKGFDLLYAAIEKLRHRNDVIFCAVGNIPENVTDENFIYLGNVRDERLMALVYAASDGYVLPSREDNFPNVMLEAMCCGTPVLSFAVGGMTDVIKPGFNGELAADISATSLAHGLERFIENIYTYDRKKIRQFIIDKYDLPIQANKYLDLYNTVLGH